LASGKTLGGLAVVAGVLVWAASVPRPLPEAAPAPVEPPPVPAPPAAPVQARRFGRRLATSFAFAVFFFAGAALAAGVVANDGGTPLVAATTTDEATTTDDGAATTTTDEVASTDEVATTDEVTTAPDEITTVTPLAPPVETDSDALTPVRAPAPAATVTPPAPQPRVAVPVPVPVPVPVRRHVTVAAPPVAPFPIVAFDPQAWLADNPGTPVGNAAVAIAMHYLGVAYRWGGNTPQTGFDCSGLTQYVYAQLGIWLPHYAAAQFLAFPRLDASQLEPGDLVFFEPKADGPGHTAIYAGHGAIIEAPHTGATVRVGSLAGAAAALGFLGAVRPTATGLARELAAVAPERGPGTWFVEA
jgi:cell wall-associated NlpC family hydrolase